MPVPESGCWIWTGTLNRQGYGVIAFSGRQWKAHRASYEVHHGVAVPSEVFVCHRCDTPSCVNPDHLFLGTPKDNSQDAAQKLRMCMGERHHSTVLTEQQVKDIFLSLDAQRRLADRYGVERQVVEKIKRRITWKSVTDGLKKPVVSRRKVDSELRKAILAAAGSQRQIAKRFGISQGHVCRIRQGAA